MASEKTKRIAELINNAEICESRIDAAKQVILNKQNEKKKLEFELNNTKKELKELGIEYD